MVLNKIVSGGQTGADIAGLRAAKDSFIPTGGWIPAGYRTEEGPKEEYWKEFGLIATQNRNYKQRTVMNVRDSDGTLIIAWDLNSSGTKETISTCKIYERPYYLLDLNTLTTIYTGWQFGDNKQVKELVIQIVEWIKTNNIKILNIAGNRESKKPIEKIAYEILIQLFKVYKNSQ